MYYFQCSKKCILFALLYICSILSGLSSGMMTNVYVYGVDFYDSVHRYFYPEEKNRCVRELEEGGEGNFPVVCYNRWFFAAKKNRHELGKAIIKLCKEKRIPVLELSNANGKTALHVAVYFNSMEFVNLILFEIYMGRGDLLWVKDDNGDTPLDIAFREGNEEMIKKIQEVVTYINTKAHFEMIQRDFARLHL